jgi:hypothetical protein
VRRACVAFFSGLVLVGACRALPSAVPLSNTGGVLEDTGTDRDRQPQAPLALGAGSLDSKPAPPPPSRAAPAPVEALPDAGAPAPPVAAGDGGVVAAAWAGDYFGNDRLTRHFEGEPDDVELDDKAHTRVEMPGPNTLLISIVNSASGDVICALRATAQGATATLDPSQECFGDENSTAAVADGRVTLAGDRLVLDFNGTVVASTGDDDDTDDDTIEFHLEYHFDGRRR